MKRIRKYLNTFLIINLLCVLLFNSTAYATESSSAANEDWPTAPDVSAESAIVMEASTGTILYAKNIDTARYPASITKIMTTMLALENCDLTETVTFTEECFYNMESGATHIGATTGETMSLEDALYGVMLASANEVSNAVAIHVAGSVSKFADLMNERAEELGCTNTHFSNPNGLHSEDHYTTAHDMALIMRAAMQNQDFRTITNTAKYTIGKTNKTDEVRYLTNHHQMINPVQYPQYAYQYAIGGKTGYTSDAGNTLVTVAKKDGIELICVILKGTSVSTTENVYTNTIDLFDYYFANYSVYNISDQTSTPTFSEDLLFTKFNSLFNSAETPITISGDSTVVIPNTANVEDVVQSVEYYDDVTIDPTTSNVIGQITYTLDGVTVGSNDIIYDSTKEVTQLETESKVVEKKGTTDSLTDVFDLSNQDARQRLLSTLGIIVFIIIVLFIILKFLRYKKRLSYKKNRKTTNVTNVYKRYKRD